MTAIKVFSFRDPAGLSIGLGEQRRLGLTARGILFLACDPRGNTHLAIPENFDVVTSIRVGDKLSLRPPWQGRMFHFDAIHRLPGNTVLWNGDRRLHDTGAGQEVACVVAEWLKGASAKNVFLGCTPHQPAAWWTTGMQGTVAELHARGLVDTVVIASGILARRIGEPHLYHLSWQELAKEGPSIAWPRVYTASRGNILLVERRVQNYRLALTCENGLVEIDVSGMPEVVTTTAEVDVEQGIGVVGRIDGGAFAITQGMVEPWGLADVSPATLIGAPNECLTGLPEALEKVSMDISEY